MRTEHDTAAAPRGYTTRDLARLLRVGQDRIRGWIRTGALAALNVAEPCAKPRFVVLPDQLADFTRRRSTAPPPRPARRRRQAQRDYYPDAAGGKVDGVSIK